MGVVGHHVLVPVHLPKSTPMRHAKRERSLLLALMLTSVSVLLGVEMRVQTATGVHPQPGGWADAPAYAVPASALAATQPDRMISRIRPVTDERPLSF